MFSSVSGSTIKSMRVSNDRCQRFRNIGDPVNTVSNSSKKISRINSLAYSRAHKVAQIKSKVANEDERPYFYIASYLTLYKQELRMRLNKT